MANKTNPDKSAAGINTSFNNVVLTLRAKEDIHVFEERPRMDNSAEAGCRKGAHELFSLFTADIIKKNIVFTR
jgi:hypothetical protein